MFTAACAKLADDLMPALSDKRLDVIIEVLTTCLATAIVSVSETREEGSELARRVAVDLVGAADDQWQARIEGQ